MWKSLLAVCILMGAVLWTPVWFYGALFVLAIVFFPYRIVYILPAILADVMYAPTDTFRLENFSTTLLVGGCIAIWMLLLAYTRLSYVVQT